MTGGRFEVYPIPFTPFIPVNSFCLVKNIALIVTGFTRN